MFGGESYDERDYGDAKYYEALKESDFASDYNALSNTTLSSTKVEPPIYTGSDTNTYKAKTISGALQDVYIKVDGKDYAITDGLSDDLKWKILSRNLKPIVKNSALDRTAEEKLIEELKKKWGNPKKGVTGNSSISTTTTSTTNTTSSQTTGGFADMFLGNSSISNIRKRLNKLGNMISGFFMSVEKGIRKFRDNLKGIFDGIADEFLNGLSEKADMELSKVLDVVRYYVAWIQVEFDKLNNIKLFKGISDNVNQEMAKVLDLVKAWLDRIKQSLESFKAPNILTGVAVGFQNELDNAYDYLVPIQGAIQKGLNGINWDEVFKFPADVVNKVSSALRGIFDSLPADFNLGKWLAEHLSITMEHIDWNAIERNVNDFSKNVVDTINGFLNNDRFWNNANVTLDKAIKVVIKFIEPILDIDLNALAKRVKDLVNSAINSGALERTVANAGQVVVDLVVAVDIALKGIKWGDLAKQISTGVADAIDKIFANKNNIKKMIQNAFGSFSTTIEETLKGMIDRNSFSKLADIIGETLLGIVTGAADFFDDVADEADKAMKQFSDRFVKFLKTNEKTIVKSLNTIIDGIVAIVDSFWDETRT